MDKRRANDGVAMVELVLVILIMSGLSTMVLMPFQLESITPEAFSSLVIHTQFDALLTHQTLTVESPIVSDYPIRFNANGNVNQGQTIRIGKTDLVIQIASGRIREKSLSDD